MRSGGEDSFGDNEGERGGLEEMRSEETVGRTVSTGEGESRGEDRSGGRNAAGGLED